MDFGCHFLRSEVAGGGISACFAGSVAAASAIWLGTGIGCANGVEGLGCHFFRSTDGVADGVVEEIAVEGWDSMAIGVAVGDAASTGIASRA